MSSIFGLFLNIVYHFGLGRGVGTGVGVRVRVRVRIRVRVRVRNSRVIGDPPTTGAVGPGLVRGRGMNHPSRRRNGNALSSAAFSLLSLYPLLWFLLYVLCLTFFFPLLSSQLELALFVCLVSLPCLFFIYGFSADVSTFI